MTKHLVIVYEKKYTCFSSNIKGHMWGTSPAGNKEEHEINKAYFVDLIKPDTVEVIDNSF